ncbi:PepSY-like domain-containing protein [Brachyspira sp. SAP_772]|uniref:PepSY-like domain-containing protein n=1 Tax=Brachyspira sp. SAP_772 TaxID=2608385 RepID=UPI0012F47DD7|nr:PepSY-like domain-containing protein [Brachyspira sp. SAP_772]
MKKTLYIIFALSMLITSYAYSKSVAISEVPKSAIAFADKYFPDNYLYRASEMSGTYILIFKGGLKIYVNNRGEWGTISGGGNEISIDYLEENIKNAIKKEFPNEKVIYIQKKSKDYKIEFKNRQKITIDFDGNIKK